MRWPLVLLAASACGRVFGLEPPVHEGDGDGGSTDGRTGDGSQDTTPSGSCIDRWMNGTVAFQMPVKIGLSGAGNDTDAFVTSDGLTFVYSKAGDFHYTTRNAPSDPFGTSTTPITSLNSASAETKLWVASSGLRGFFSSNRIGGQGGWDLWRAARGVITDPWTVDQLYLNDLNDADDQHDPHLSVDLLRIYYAPDNGGQHIEMASRASIADSFADPAPIAQLDSAFADADPALTADELVIVFSSTRTGIRDLYYATRPSMMSAFSAPTPLTALNTPTLYEGGPHISDDGCTLYYEIAAAPNNSDIYVTALQ